MIQPPGKSDMGKLRDLLRGQMLSNNHGNVDVARIAGVSQPSVSTILSGQGGVSVEMCIRLAAYLAMPVIDVLRIAGHVDVARLLAEVGPSEPAEYGEYVTKIAHALNDLDDYERALVIRNAVKLANTIRETRSPIIIGVNDKH